MLAARSRMPEEAVGVEAAGLARPGSPTPSSATSSAALGAVAPPRDRDLAGLGVALDVGDRLLGDAPQLPLLEDRQPAGLLGPQLAGQAAALLHPVEEGLERGGEALRLGDVGAQVVEGVADLADDAPDVGAEVVERRRVVAAAGAVLDDAVELEGEVGERLADAVVQVAGDAGALLVGADGAEAAEPAGVVDGQGGRLDEAGEQLDVAVA